ncbi:MAG: hypothetical protein K8S97_11810 [Anaerolineae bacterium]|nr:hypothetical protein [Anaerolineae bacterium]
MRKLLSILIGLVLIVAAVVILWIAHGPQSSAATTTGGMLYTQAELAANGTNTLDTVIDTDIGTQPLPPALAPAAAADLQSADAAELSAAPETVADLDEVPSAPLTTNIVIETDTEIEVAPIAQSGPDMVAPPDGQGGQTQMIETDYEQRVVELEWPARFQVKRSGSLRVKLKVLDSGALQPVAEVADNEIIATPILITNRYATHDAFVTLTISAPDFSIDSLSNATQQMLPAGAVEWRWTLESDDAQTSVISLSMTISWQPKPDQVNPPPAPQNVYIWGQTVQVEVVYVFGLISVPQASILGTVMALAGLVAQYPILEKLLEAFIDRLLGRDRREEKKQSSKSDDRRDRRY